MSTIHRITLTVTCLSLALTLSACSNEDTDAVTPTSSSSQHDMTKLPTDLTLTDEPDDSRDVAAFKSELDGEADVVLRGRVKDFAPNHAIFTLVDEGLKHCGEMEDDVCPTPWDYCCVPKDEQTAGTVTVEVHVDGKPVKKTLEGYAGIDHLTDVVVRGHAKKDDAGNVILVADGIYVAK